MVFSSTNIETPDTPAIFHDISGQELIETWPNLPRRARLGLLKAFAQTVERYEKSGYLLEDISIHGSRFTLPPQKPAVQLWPPPSEKSTQRIPHTRYIYLLSKWYDETRDLLQANEFTYLMRQLKRSSCIDRECQEFAGKQIMALSQQRSASVANRFYAQNLNSGLTEDDRVGYWQPAPQIGPASLLAHIITAETDPATHFYKRGDTNMVFQASLLGEDCVIKRHDITKQKDQVKYRYRKSRGRRAWAAAKTLKRMNIATPAPLGFADTIQDDGTLTSYFVSRAIPGARSAREYIKPQLHNLPADVRQRVSGQLIHMLFELYSHGIYHSDTKTSNMLVTEEQSEADRTFHWIDLDSMQFGINATRPLMIRNLIQLNGSIGTRISREDRLFFLSQFAERFPWARSTRVIRTIERKTRKRLLREVKRECGH